MTTIRSKAGRSKDVRRLYHRDVPADNQAEIDAAKRHNRDPETRPNQRRIVPIACRSTPMRKWARAALTGASLNGGERTLVGAWMLGKDVRL